MLEFFSSSLMEAGRGLLATVLRLSQLMEFAQVFLTFFVIYSICV